mmetsp:Transcript_22296/g.39468  ORF Transcript_22296/g.39468 Transcript_22296/m.39468 type:complete len:241 (+) Transcript_22296:208-930(+)
MASEAKLHDSDDVGEVSKRRRFYTPAEVALHNCAKDCWVSAFGKVLDLTPLLASIAPESEDAALMVPIEAHAGKDVSHWFDKGTCEVKRARDESTGLVLPVLPHGRFLHVAPAEPVSNWNTDFQEPWWRDDESYCIGSLSESVRSVCIVNMLTYQETVLEVCEEETIREIEDRYLDWNAHSQSYTWKILDGDCFRPLDMDLNLTENGLEDENALFDKLSIPRETFIPTIHVYFNDDLTIE